MRGKIILWLILVVNITNFVFSQDKQYFSVSSSKTNELSLHVLCILEDSTYRYYSLFRNKDSVWTRIDSSFGKWSSVKGHKIELQTYDYINADNETKKLLRVLSCCNYLTSPCFTLTVHKHYVINKEYSSEPMVDWKRLSLNEHDRQEVGAYLINAVTYSTDR